MRNLYFDKVNFYSVDSIYEDLELDERMQFYNHICSRISAIDRICIILFFVDEYSLSEIANIIEINQRHVERILYQGVDNLRVIISEFFQQDLSSQTAVTLLNNICVDMRFSQYEEEENHLHKEEFYFSNY